MRGSLTQKNSNPTGPLLNQKYFNHRKSKQNQLNLTKRTAMNIQAEKLHIMKLILDTDDPRMIESIKNLFINERKGDFWESLTKEQKSEIESGISEIENGERVDYETVMGKHRK